MLLNCLPEVVEIDLTFLTVCSSQGMGPDLPEKSNSKTATGSVTGSNHSLLICESCRSCSAREHELEAVSDGGSRSPADPREMGWILD